jgi:hypothetical protein
MSNPLFTHRHYEFFANRLAQRRTTIPTVEWCTALYRWCELFSEDNPRFDEKRFRRVALHREIINSDRNHDIDVFSS